MNNYSGNETVNAGTGKEISIKELSELVAKTVGYTGRIVWDTTKPNGTPRKLLDVSKKKTPTERYIELLNDHPQLFDIVPLQEIAFSIAASGAVFEVP